MKKGISRWCFKESSYSEIFPLAKSLGFDGVELTMDMGGELTPETTDEALIEIKKKAEEAGIELYSMASSLYWSYSLSSPDKEMREKAVAHDRNGKSSQVLVYHLSLIFLFLVCAEESLLY